MPLKKLQLKPGVNRENTRYTNEGGWYESDKVRFRQGTPETIGGWEPLTTTSTYVGVCRSLYNWATLSHIDLIGIGTDKKFYIEKLNNFIDVTPITIVHTMTNPFSTNGTTTVTVTDSSGVATVGNYVTFSGGTSVGGVLIQGEYQIKTKPSSTTFTIQIGSTPTTATGGGTVIAQYQLDPGSEVVQALDGWGSGTWSRDTWGSANSSITTYYRPLALCDQANFGEDLIFGWREGALYYWDATTSLTQHMCTLTSGVPLSVSTDAAIVNGTPIVFSTSGSLPTGILPSTVYYAINVVGSTFNIAASVGGSPISTTGSPTATVYLSQRAYPLASLPGASDVPSVQTGVLIADNARIVMCFGANGLNTTDLDPMLIRWSDQEDPANWTPSVTNQAGDLRLSIGSKIVSYLQVRQEILVWTDAALYSLQYQGPPTVWGSQILASNVSVASPKATATAGGVVYWMGVDKFYMYDGVVKTLNCDLRSFVFNDINNSQTDQIFAATNESFNEIWWFYCTAGSTTIDRYVVYNYLENVWYYGSMARTAWIDSGIRHNPIAATYEGYLVKHESGLNDNVNGTPVPIDAYIVSSEFDLDDGHSFAFVYRVLPDVTFKNSTATSPTVLMSLYPMSNSGSGYVNNSSGDNYSVAGTSYANISRSALVPIEQFTGQVFTRVRGRQLAFKVSSNQLNTAWQWGSPRIDIRPDGRR